METLFFILLTIFFVCIMILVYLLFSVKKIREKLLSESSKQEEYFNKARKKLDAIVSEAYGAKIALSKMLEEAKRK